MSFGLSEKALAICKDKFVEHDAQLCHSCPIRQACKSPMPLGNAGLIAWRDSVNAAAEKVGE